jgi:hypothetical protein
LRASWPGSLSSSTHTNQSEDFFIHLNLRNEDALVEALSMDALVPCMDVASRLVREMTAFQTEYLPQVAR